MKRIAVVLGLICTAMTVYGQRPWDYERRHQWENSWNRHPMPRSGACFFSQPGFRGERFCLTRGQSMESLPGDLRNNISSIQLFGYARATVFNHSGFRGGSQEFRWSVADLRSQRYGDGHTWNNRISSIAVR
jgi:hypothetical protein